MTPTAPPEDAAAETALPLAEQAFRRLRRSIVMCEFPPGQRLRVEELSRTLAISSSPLREALSRLVEQGLVQAFENRGFHVAPLTVEGIADLTRVRLLVESEALRDAMLRGDDAWEARVVAAAHGLGLVEQRLGDQAPLLDASWSGRHRDYHLALYGGSGSAMLRNLVQVLFDNAERYRQFSARHRTVRRAKNAEHQDLMAAVLRRDADTAVGLLHQHISGTERNVVDALLSMAPGTRQ